MRNYSFNEAYVDFIKPFIEEEEYSFTTFKDVHVTNFYGCSVVQVDTNDVAIISNINCLYSDLLYKVGNVYAIVCRKFTRDVLGLYDFYLTLHKVDGNILEDVQYDVYQFAKKYDLCFVEETTSLNTYHVKFSGYFTSEQAVQVGKDKDLLQKKYNKKEG